MVTATLALTLIIILTGGFALQVLRGIGDKFFLAAFAAKAIFEFFITKPELVIVGYFHATHRINTSAGFLFLG